MNKAILRAFYRLHYPRLKSSDDLGIHELALLYLVDSKLSQRTHPRLVGEEMAVI